MINKIRKQISLIMNDMNYNPDRISLLKKIALSEVLIGAAFIALSRFICWMYYPGLIVGILLIADASIFVIAYHKFKKKASVES